MPTKGNKRVVDPANWQSWKGGLGPAQRLTSAGEKVAGTDGAKPTESTPDSGLTAALVEL